MNKKKLDGDCGCEDIKVRSLRLDDGRHAEEHVIENYDPCTGEGEIVKELYAEEERPRPLRQVVREKVQRCVTERTIEDVDSEGTVVNRVVESIEPSSAKLHVIERQQVAAAHVEAQSQDCYVTREDMQDMFIAAINNVNRGHAVAPTRNLQSEVKTKFDGETTGGDSWNQNVTLGLLALITAEAALLAWVLWFM